MLKLLEEGPGLLDYPWLVRLNPAAPWKTRGNAAVAVLAAVDTRSEAARLAETVLRLSKSYLAAASSPKASLYAIYVDEADSLKDYMRLREPCLVELYRRSIHEITPTSEALRCAARLDTVASLGETRRGVVGALSALGYEPGGDYTFELLTYREPRLWTEPRRVDPHSVLEFDVRTRPHTFMNYDYVEDKPLIAPHGTDPVLYGVRGEEPATVLQALEEIDTGGEEPTHWALFRTNQATGHHLRPKTVSRTRPYDSPILYLTATKRPRRLPGGHVVLEARDHTGSIHVVAYRETGAVRKLVERLEPGMSLAAAGQVKPRQGVATLNLEYVAADPGLVPEAWWMHRLCGFVQPPLSRLHHLAVPYQRCPRLGEAKTMSPPITPPAGFTRK